MSLYFFDISNSLEDQQFLIEADDLVSAHMKALDFARELDDRIARELDETETTEVVTVAKAPILWANAEGQASYLANVKVNCFDEDEE